MDAALTRSIFYGLVLTVPTSYNLMTLFEGNVCFVKIEQNCLHEPTFYIGEFWQKCSIPEKHVFHLPSNADVVIREIY